MSNSKLSLYDYSPAEKLETIKNYAASRYYRWLDYASYHSTLAKKPDEANDILNEVLISLFSKDFNKLYRLYSERRGLYTSLDFFVLQMIKMNTYSPTSPYRYKYRNLPINDEVEVQKLEIAEVKDEDVDNPATILKQVRLVRYIFDRLELTDLERAVFEFRFLLHKSFSAWPKPISRRAFYGTYFIVQEAIHEILYNEKLTNLKPNTNSSYNLKIQRKSEIIKTFYERRKIHIN
jgi:hypothetical protein